MNGVGFKPATFASITHHTHYSYLSIVNKQENKEDICFLPTPIAFHLCRAFVRKHIPMRLEPQDIASILYKMLFYRCFSVTNKVKNRKNHHKRTYLFRISHQINRIESSDNTTTDQGNNNNNTKNNNNNNNVLLSVLFENHSCDTQMFSNKGINVTFGVLGISKGSIRMYGPDIKNIFDKTLALINRGKGFSRRRVKKGSTGIHCHQMMENVFWMNTTLRQLNKEILMKMHWYGLNIDFFNHDDAANTNDNQQGLYCSQYLLNRRYFLNMSHGFFHSIKCPQTRVETIKGKNMIKKITNNGDEKYADIILFEKKDYIQACYDKNLQSIYFLKNGNKKQKMATNLTLDNCNSTQNKRRWGHASSSTLVEFFESFENGNIKLNCEKFEYFLFFQTPVCGCRGAAGFTFGFAF